MPGTFIVDENLKTPLSALNGKKFFTAKIDTAAQKEIILTIAQKGLLPPSSSARVHYLSEYLCKGEFLFKPST